MFPQMSLKRSCLIQWVGPWSALTKSCFHNLQAIKCLFVDCHQNWWNFNFKDDLSAQSSTTLFLPVSTRRLPARLAGQNNANDGEWYFYVISISLKSHTLYIIQGCALKKIKGSPVLLICETIGAQNVICMKTTKLF